MTVPRPRRVAAALVSVVSVVIFVIVVGAAAVHAGGARGSALDTSLFAKLRGAPGNLVVSPASARAALSLVRAGAAGKTRAELERLVHAGGGVPGENLVVAGAGVTLSAAFREEAERTFHARVLDAAHAGAPGGPALGDAARRILAGVDADGVLVENTLAFKGRWRSRFDKRDTRELPFQLDERTRKPVPMMTLVGPLRARRRADVDVVELPYADGGAMLLAVPRKRTSAALAAVERVLDPARLGAGLREQAVALSLPRFSVSSTHELEAALTALGLKHAFCKALPAVDLSRLGTAAAGPLCVADVVQRVSVDVDEEGTTAAADTEVRLLAAEGEPERPPPLEIAADHPFLFVVRDASGAVTFVGRVADPAPDAPALRGD